MINKYNLCLFKYLVVYTALGQRDVQIELIATDEDLQELIDHDNNGVTILGVINLEEEAM